MLPRTEIKNSFLKLAHVAVRKLICNERDSNPVLGEQLLDLVRLANAAARKTRNVLEENNLEMGLLPRRKDRVDELAGAENVAADINRNMADVDAAFRLAGGLDQCDLVGKGSLLLIVRRASRS